MNEKTSDAKIGRSLKINNPINHGEISIKPIQRLKRVSTEGLARDDAIDNLFLLTEVLCMEAHFGQ